MWKRRWSKRGVTNRSSIHEQPRPLAEAKVVTPQEFHKQVMRMLAVYDGQSVRSLSRLKKFRIPPLGNRSRFETEHGSEGHCLTPEIARDHPACGSCPHIISKRNPSKV